MISEENIKKNDCCDVLPMVIEKLDLFHHNYLNNEYEWGCGLEDILAESIKELRIIDKVLHPEKEV